MEVKTSAIRIQQDANTKPAKAGKAGDVPTRPFGERDWLGSRL